jgi:3-dehydroquinate synthase II
LKEVWVFAEDVEHAQGVDRVVSRSRGIVEGKGERLRLVQWQFLGSSGVDPGSTVLELEVRNAGDEENALKAVEKGFRKILVKTSDWKVIPWENLVAKLRGRAMIVAEASTVEEAKLALRALQLGVDAVALNMPVNEASRAAEELRNIEAVLRLREAIVEKVSEAGMGLRACIDACDAMSPGEGMLIGAFSSMLILIEAEVVESGFTKPRPFRVNAGAVSQYVLSTGGLSPYVSDLRSGDVVLAVSRRGEARPLTICRMKVEKRPLRMVEASLNGLRGKVFLQDAETIRVVTPDGSRSVRDLKPGDVVIAYSPGRVGRHFGTPVEGELMVEF